MRLRGIPQHKPLPDYNLDPPDDDPWAACPTCGCETDNFTESCDGDHRGRCGKRCSAPAVCDECAKACPRCGEAGMEKVSNRGWCQACVDLGRRGRKAVRKGLTIGRRERKLRRREYQRKGWLP